MKELGLGKNDLAALQKMNWSTLNAARKGSVAISARASVRAATPRSRYTIRQMANRFPGVIPASRLWAPGQALLGLFPLPNQTLAPNGSLPSGATYNYQTRLPGKQHRREDMVRIDYNMTRKLRIYVHFIKDQQNLVIPYGPWVPGINQPIALISDAFRARDWRFCRQ
jgi:hypothetical protein